MTRGEAYLLCVRHGNLISVRPTRPGWFPSTVRYAYTVVVHRVPSSCTAECLPCACRERNKSRATPKRHRTRCARKSPAACAGAPVMIHLSLSLSRPLFPFLSLLFFLAIVYAYADVSAASKSRPILSSPQRERAPYPNGRSGLIASSANRNLWAAGPYRVRVVVTHSTRGTLSRLCVRSGFVCTSRTLPNPCGQCARQ